MPSLALAFFKALVFFGIAFSPESYYIANMDTAIKSELDTLKEIIIRTVPVEQIWLFGSYAYGTPHKDSDLYLYVVLKDDVEMRLIDVAINIRIAIGRKKQCLLMLLRTLLADTKNAPVSRHWNGL